MTTTRGVGCSLVVLAVVAQSARGQTWNDSLSRALVDRATARRAEQLADTGLTAYRADAHGYVTFLAQLGEGFPVPPKVVKADELALEVYWHAPNLSKQRIIGRRDTLLLPTDIRYHRDHLGIVQNNFPSIIRLGEGDEVADVPHPLSQIGLREYDFAISDSLPIHLPGRDINVYEVKVRPKDDRKARVIGALYIDQSGGQVVRMAFNFTRAAFLDKQLEDLSIVLENGLVGGQYWLPHRQEIEIRRSGTWLDYPVRGIIRGRWEIANYRFDVQIPGSMFATGPEIVQAPLQEQARYPWKGLILDSLPPDVRAVTDADVSRIQAEARQLVRAQALAHVRSTAASARGISDIVHFNRVEGLAVGGGVAQRFGSGLSATARARYGVDDKEVKGEATLAWQHASGFGVSAFGLRGFREVGDEQERSAAINSIAAQEFASDYTDPYFVRGAGVGMDFPAVASVRFSLSASIERHDSVRVNAAAVRGSFVPTLGVAAQRHARITLEANRSPALWLFGTELEARAEIALLAPPARDSWQLGDVGRNLRASIRANIERPIGAGGQRLVLHTVGAASATTVLEDLAYFGGPATAPGYDYHSLWSRTGIAQRIEWRTPAPFVSFSLGRFGRVPARGTLAPFANVVFLGASNCGNVQPDGGAESAVRSSSSRPSSCFTRSASGYPSLGVGYLTPFDLIRLDVARGLRDGRWTFYVDVSRELWRIL
jgi:hypothetical protein